MNLFEHVSMFGARNNTSLLTKEYALLFSHPNINTEQLIDEKDLYDYLTTRVIIKKRVVFMVKNDKWFLYLLK